MAESLHPIDIDERRAWAKLETPFLALEERGYNRGHRTSKVQTLTRTNAAKYLDLNPYNNVFSLDVQRILQETPKTRSQLATNHSAEISEFPSRIKTNESSAPQSDQVKYDAALARQILARSRTLELISK